MNYFELYPGDYLRDTTRLTLIEHGAYLRLLMTYYSEEQPLPASEAELFVIVAATTAADKEAVRKVAARFFPVATDGTRRNGRVDDEIAKARKRIDTAKANGAKNKPKANPAGMPVGDPPGDPPGKPADTQPPTHSGEALHAPHATKDKELPLPTEADAIASEVAKAADPIWDTGLAFLIRKGLPEKPARALLGKVKQTAGDAEAARILADAEIEDITNPAPWLLAAAAQARSRVTGGKHSAAADFRGKSYESTPDDELPESLR